MRISVGLLVRAMPVLVFACAAFACDPRSPGGQVGIIGNPPFPLVAIAPGTFLMGSEKGYNCEKPVHRVTITKAFYIGRTEVTQEQYRSVMNASPSGFKGDNSPVDSVSWFDATEFCRKLTETENQAGRLPPGMAYRLPTEAEWEYCCRSGRTTEYSFGASGNRLSDNGWFSENSGKTTHRVARKDPNAWCLYDMHGNVAEWCYDAYSETYDAGEASDPSGPASGEFRVLRGGCWHFDAVYCRSSSRACYKAGGKYNNVGFRVVLGPAPVGK
ncbi:MAG: formylglycine-generating enzyme family protein [Candidatus Brocadiia bacterium]